MQRVETIQDPATRVRYLSLITAHRPITLGGPPPPRTEGPPPPARPPRTEEPPQPEGLPLPAGPPKQAEPPRPEGQQLPFGPPRPEGPPIPARALLACTSRARLTGRAFFANIGRTLLALASGALIAPTSRTLLVPTSRVATPTGPPTPAAPPNEGTSAANRLPTVIPAGPNVMIPVGATRHRVTIDGKRYALRLTTSGTLRSFTTHGVCKLLFFIFKCETFVKSEISIRRNFALRSEGRM